MGIEQEVTVEVIEVAPGIFNRIYVCAGCGEESRQMTDRTGMRRLQFTDPSDPDVVPVRVKGKRKTYDGGPWEEGDPRCLTCRLRAEGLPSLDETLADAERVLGDLARSGLVPGLRTALLEGAGRARRARQKN